MSKLRKIKAPIPLLCYGVCLIGFLAMCLWHFAGDSLARANGRLAEAQMTLCWPGWSSRRTAPS